MRKVFLVCSLLTLGLSGFAVAGTPEAPELLLEELRAAIFMPAPTGGAPLGGEWKASCTVSNDCGTYSPTISCSSASGNCRSGSTWIECDGKRTNCAPCSVSTRCPNGFVISCTGTSTTGCIKDNCSVFCGGDTLQVCSPCIHN